MRIARSLWIVLFALQCLVLTSGSARAEEKSAAFITEAYYRIQWGHFDEFMELFKKNHYPILERLKELGETDIVIRTEDISKW